MLLNVIMPRHIDASSFVRLFPSLSVFAAYLIIFLSIMCTKYHPFQFCVSLKNYYVWHITHTFFGMLVLLETKKS